MFTLYNDDCFKVMGEMVARGEKFDCIIADVPYNINFESWDTGFDIESAIKLSLDLLTDKGSLILFQGWSNVSDVVSLVQKNHYGILQNWIVWDRIKGRGGKKNFTSTREDILWISKSETYTFNKVYSNIPKKTKGMGEKNGQSNRSLTNVWYDISPIVPWSKERNGHPTQKPVQLMDRIVDIWTNEGDSVLDFTAGSGSTGESCLRKNRQFTGIERDEKWFNVMKERLESIE